MKNFEGRLSKLEHRVGIGGGAARYLVILTDRDLEPTEEDAYIRILAESKFLPTTGVGMVDFTVIPRGLSANETERFVRENGAEICGGRLPRIAR